MKEMLLHAVAASVIPEEPAYSPGAVPLPTPSLLSGGDPARGPGPEQPSRVVMIQIYRDITGIAVSHDQMCGFIESDFTFTILFLCHSPGRKSFDDGTGKGGRYYD
ncbi:hypothetical protein [Methanofollis ethanolicus]|uniref:hypothetical protein n=1 Tax=Methanofollis ethanolicus TaxID=488124 RepID=UPI00082D23C4|nr:hypothetical protein [Methanofollis ethanolicus]